MRLKHLIILLLFVSYPAFADTHEAATCENKTGQLDVQAAINLSTTGDTVAVPTGSCTWDTNVSIPSNKKITLQGAGKTSTLITNKVLSLSTSGSRVTGFGFTGTTIFADGTGLRIDNNSFTYSTRTVAIQVSGYNPSSHPTGLIDGNTFVKGAILVFGFVNTEAGMANASWLWGQATGLGTGTNVVFIENNNFTSGDSGAYYIDCMDANYGARFVFRYNTLYNTHTEFHGIQSSSNRGNPRWEIYNNSYTTTIAAYNAIFARGGTGVIYNNSFVGPYTLNINIDNQTSTRYGDYACTPDAPYAYLDNTPCDGNNPRDGNRTGMEGYPCRDQIGRGQDVPQWAVGETYAQTLAPAYFWGNIDGTSDASSPAITRESPLTSCIPSNTNRHLLHLVADRDFYFSSAVQTSKGIPFDGTSGVGVGTLAQRPDTCDPLPVATGLEGETGGGVAYWATDTNTLYRCSATNTWTVHYTPYTYPHPLRGPFAASHKVGVGSTIMNGIGPSIKWFE